MNDQRQEISAPAGSSSEGGPFFVVMGKLRKPHGIRGEMVMTVLTDFPELLAPGQEVYVGEEYQPLTVRSIRWHKDDMLVGFEEYEDRDLVGVHRNQLLFITVEDLPELPEEEFFFHEMIGLEVITDTGQELGTLGEILDTGANDVYVVEREGKKDILLPATEEVILEVSLEKGWMKVHLLPGLMDE